MKWEVVPGTFTMMIACSSIGIKLKGESKITLSTANELRYVSNDSINNW